MKNPREIFSQGSRVLERKQKEKKTRERKLYNKRLYSFSGLGSSGPNITNPTFFWARIFEAQPSNSFFGPMCFQPELSAQPSFFLKPVYLSFRLQTLKPNTCYPKLYLKTNAF